MTARDFNDIGRESGPEGVRERSVLSAGTSDLFWPKDGQIAIIDLDRDGHPEIWFANEAGDLWQFDPTRSPGLTCISRTTEVSSG